MESKSFAHSLHVHPNDIDEQNHVNNVVYVRWIQEAAAAHWNAWATQEIKNKYFWVVLRHEIDYKNAAFLNDEITAHTWVVDYNRVRSIRHVQLLRKHDDKLLAEAKTTWCLMNVQTHKPTRIGQDIIDIFAKHDTG